MCTLQNMDIRPAITTRAECAVQQGGAVQRQINSSFVRYGFKSRQESITEPEVGWGGGEGRGQREGEM